MLVAKAGNTTHHTCIAWENIMNHTYYANLCKIYIQYIYIYICYNIHILYTIYVINIYIYIYDNCIWSCRLISLKWRLDQQYLGRWNDSLGQKGRSHVPTLASNLALSETRYLQIRRNHHAPMVNDRNSCQQNPQQIEFLTV